VEAAGEADVLVVGAAETAPDFVTATDSQAQLAKQQPQPQESTLPDERGPDVTEKQPQQQRSQSRQEDQQQHSEPPVSDMDGASDTGSLAQPCGDFLVGALLWVHARMLSNVCVVRKFENGGCVLSTWRRECVF
jgi:hypothetical protein